MNNSDPATVHERDGNGAIGERDVEEYTMVGKHGRPSKPRQPMVKVLGTRERQRLSRAVDPQRRQQLGRYTSIFATRFQENVSSEEVLQDLQEAGINTDNLKCEKLQTRHTGYASFRVHGRCADPDVLLQPETWDKDIFVKWYYVKKAESNATS